MKNIYVLGFCFTEDKSRVVLINKNKPKHPKGLNGVGGKVEKTDDSFMQAMCREFLEETGVSTITADWESVGKIEGVNFLIVVFRNFNDDHFEAAKTMEAEKISKEWLADLIHKESVSHVRTLVWHCISDLDCEITLCY